MDDAAGIQRESDALPFCLSGEQRAGGVEERTQLHGQAGDGHLPALDLADIQDLIHQIQQMRTGHQDLVQAILHAIPIIQALQSDVSEPRDGIHGCAEIVGDVRQEG